MNSLPQLKAWIWQSSDNHHSRTNWTSRYNKHSKSIRLKAAPWSTSSCSHTLTVTTRKHWFNSKPYLTNPMTIIIQNLNEPAKSSNIPNFNLYRISISLQVAPCSQNFMFEHNASSDNQKSLPQLKSQMCLNQSQPEIST